MQRLNWRYLIYCLTDEKQKHTFSESDSGHKRKAMTELFDRGGLTYVNSQFVTFMEVLEHDFRTKFTSTTKTCTPNRPTYST